MRIAVLGDGVIGVTTACFLAEGGHEVILVERRKAPAPEPSHANAGEISPGLSATGVPLKVIEWMLDRHSPLVIRLRLDPAMWRWLWRMLMNCNQRGFCIHKERMQRIAH